jgi:hypothetical protein
VWISVNALKNRLELITVKTFHKLSFLIARVFSDRASGLQDGEHNREDQGVTCQRFLARRCYWELTFLQDRGGDAEDAEYVLFPCSIWSCANST